MKNHEIKKMHHLFTYASIQEIKEADRLYTIFINLRSQEEVVQVPDEFILNNPTFLSGFSSFWESLDHHENGLCYFGFTIIPSGSVDVFIQRLEDDLYFSNLTALIDLCYMCMQRKKFILHWGM